MIALPALLPDARCHTVVVDADGACIDVAAMHRMIAPVAAALGASGAPVIACADRLRFVSALLAAWSLGRVATLPVNLLPATVGQHVGEGGVIVHDGGQPSGIDITALASVAAPSSPPLLGAPTDPARRLVRLFTSGSTGVPKAIDKTAGQLVGEAAALAGRFDLAGARVLCTVPLHHIYGLLFGVLVPLCADATIVAASALHPEAVRAAIVRFGVDVLVTTPAQLRAFDVLDAGALVGMRRVFSSGAALDRDTAAMLRERLGAAVTEVFGTSETGGVATRTHRGGDPVWTPLPGVAVASDGDGRMLLHSPWLDPTLRPPVVTDDRITAVDGGFVHHGRSDDVVKVGGRRVALGDVEAKLRAVVGVDDAVAIALPVGGGHGHAIAVAVATVTRTAQDIRAALVPWFDASALPRRIVCVPSLPRESSGKLPRARVLALFGDVELSPVPIHVDVEGAEFEVEIDPALPCFVGHFPGDPILPGAVLLESVVLRSIEHAWPELFAAAAGPTGVPRAKFTLRVEPGDRLRVRLDRRAGKVTFAVTRDGVGCASGTFAFAG